MTYDFSTASPNGMGFGMMERLESQNYGMFMAQHGFVSTDMSIHDESTLRPLMQEINAHRIGGYRFCDESTVSRIFRVDDQNDAYKLSALWRLYSQENAGNPLALFETAGNFGFSPSQRHNEDVKNLVRAAVMSRNPEMAAAALTFATRGAGPANERIINAVFNPEGMNEAESARFLEATSRAFSEMNNGKTLDECIKEEFSAVGFLEGSVSGLVGGAVTGAIAGGVLGGGPLSIPFALAGAIAGGLYAEFGEIGMFGANSQGRELLSDLNEARLGTHNTGLGDFGTIY